jgi:hypothetical protein
VTSIAPDRREKSHATGICLGSACLYQRVVTVYVSSNVNKLLYLQIVSYEFGVYEICIWYGHSYSCMALLEYMTVKERTSTLLFRRENCT